MRDALALTCPRHDREFPRAFDLLATALVAFSEPLRGVASSLSGLHTPDQWREMLRGERTLPLYDVCRLATDPRREAREAVVDLLRALAGIVGHDVVPLERKAFDAFRCIADAAHKAGELSSTAIQAGRDGKLDETERSDLRDQLDDLVAKATLAKGSL